MRTYRKIRYNTENKHFVHFYNPEGSYEFNNPGSLPTKYGRDCLIRSIPENCKLSVDEFARLVIDNLYDRQQAYAKNEMRLFYVSKSNRNLKNLCK